MGHYLELSPFLFAIYVYKSLEQVMDKISLKKLTASLGGGVIAPFYTGTAFAQSHNIDVPRSVNVTSAPARIVKGKAN